MNGLFSLLGNGIGSINAILMGYPIQRVVFGYLSTGRVPKCHFDGLSRLNGTILQTWVADYEGGIKGV